MVKLLPKVYQYPLILLYINCTCCIDCEVRRLQHLHVCATDTHNLHTTIVGLSLRVYDNLAQEQLRILTVS